MVLQFDHPSKAALAPGTFPKKYLYNALFDSDHDRVVEIAKSAQKNQSRIHRLTDDQGTHYGFIALSIDVSDEKPCLIIDYLFVSQQYRGIRYHELEDKTIAGLLIGYAREIASEANNNFPISYIALIPANKKLTDYYRNLEFLKLDSTDFMYLKL